MIIIPYTSDITGRKILCKKNQSSISIVDQRAPGKFQLSMNVANECLTVKAYTKGWQGNKNSRHPDFRATEVLLKEYQYLLNTGNTIKSLQAHWKFPDRGTDNFDAFNKNLKSQGIDLSNLKEGDQWQINRNDEFFHLYQLAVQDTWTWELAQKISSEAHLRSLDIHKTRSESHPTYGYLPSELHIYTAIDLHNQ